MERGLEVRPLRPEDDVEAELALRRRAFGPVTAADESTWVASLPAIIEAGQAIGVFDGPRLVASARYYPMRQWWHGRSMPMAGVAGVKVAPEQRGRGIGRLLMTRVLADLAAAGYPLSTLYPSTLPLYRSLGWENAGGRYETVLPARALAALVPPDPYVPDATGMAAAAADVAAAAAAEAARRRGASQPASVREASAADAAAIVEVLGRAHQELRDNGPNTREPSEFVSWLDDPDQFSYLADDGFLTYRWADGHQELAVEYLVAASAATQRAFWQILASHATMADRVRACLAPDDPVGWLLSEPAAVTSLTEPWMLRLIDPAEAIAARGFPAGVTVQATLDLQDEAIPANSGHWSLEISGGAGKLAPADSSGSGSAASRRGRLEAYGSRADGPLLRFGARGLAALFAGVPISTLRRAGLIAGDNIADQGLDCAFGGPAFMCDYF
jgi:predicted acetyltransferase